MYYESLTLRFHILNALAAWFVLVSAVPATIAAQSADWSVFVGVGTAITPAYVGSDVYQLRVFPNVTITRSDRFRASLLEGGQLAVIRSGGLRVGPVVRFDPGRQEDGGSPFLVAGRTPVNLVGLGDVEGTVELGGFASYALGEATAAVEVRKAPAGHGGVVSRAELVFQAMSQVSGRPVHVAIGPTVVVADSEYSSAFFGVDGSQSARTGLPAFNAEGGLMRYGLRASLSVSQSERMSIISFATYDRIGSDLAESPVVRASTREGGAVGVLLSFRVK